MTQVIDVDGTNVLCEDNGLPISVVATGRRCEYGAWIRPTGDYSNGRWTSFGYNIHETGWDDHIENVIRPLFASGVRTPDYVLVNAYIAPQKEGGSGEFLFDWPYYWLNNRWPSHVPKPSDAQEVMERFGQSLKNIRAAVSCPLYFYLGKLTQETYGNDQTAGRIASMRRRMEESHAYYRDDCGVDGYFIDNHSQFGSENVSTNAAVTPAMSDSGEVARWSAEKGLLHTYRNEPWIGGEAWAESGDPTTLTRVSNRVQRPQYGHTVGWPQAVVSTGGSFNGALNERTDIYAPAADHYHVQLMEDVVHSGTGQTTGTGDDYIISPNRTGGTDFATGDARARDHFVKGASFAITAHDGATSSWNYMRDFLSEKADNPVPLYPPSWSYTPGTQINTLPDNQYWIYKDFHSDANLETGMRPVDEIFTTNDVVEAIYRRIPSGVIIKGLGTRRYIDTDGLGERFAEPFDSPIQAATGNGSEVPVSNDVQQCIKYVRAIYKALDDKAITLDVETPALWCECGDPFTTELDYTTLEERDIYAGRILKMCDKLAHLGFTGVVVNLDGVTQTKLDYFVDLVYASGLVFAVNHSYESSDPVAFYSPSVVLRPSETTSGEDSGALIVYDERGPKPDEAELTTHDGNLKPVAMPAVWWQQAASLIPSQTDYLTSTSPNMSLPSLTTQSEIENYIGDVAVDLASDDEGSSAITQAITAASQWIYSYLSARFVATSLASSQLVQDMATRKACEFLLSRRGNDIPERLAILLEKDEDLINRLQRGDPQVLLPGVAAKELEGPRVTNYSIEDQGLRNNPMVVVPTSTSDSFRTERRSRLWGRT